jgi:hypothetical protein
VFSELEDGILCREKDDHREADFHFGYRPRPVIHYHLPAKMSRVTISTAPCDPSASLVSDVRRITKLGVLDVRDRLSAGEPVFDQELFGNRTEDVFAKARALLSALEYGGHQPLVSEAGRPITPQILRNIFQASEEEAEELRRLDDLGHV